jgi:hypothetical protein
MPNNQDVSRRNALAATCAAAVIGLSATEVSAQKPGGDRERPPELLKLRVVLSDGQVLDLKASQLLIDFGGNSRLLVKPEGQMRPVDGEHGPESDKQGIRQG